MKTSISTQQSSRDRFQNWRRPIMQRHAVRAFLGGITMLVIYLISYELVADITTAREIYRGNSWLIPGDLLLLISYAGFFVFTTLAFMLLGMTEYYGLSQTRHVINQ